ncbi:uncharacterized protein [Solanum tuberosum]|uniref:uncharacterized protein n=1 Tax=Solanum tuberosum TaxID=4113 RepID=UPI00073A3750|nr:PREDICTED: uncharacterized protein LOC102587023 [Solanum tuberosum]
MCCIVLKSSIISMGKHHIHYVFTQINTLQGSLLQTNKKDFGAHISPAKETKAILFTDKRSTSNTCNERSTFYQPQSTTREPELTGMKYPNVNTLPCSPSHFINSLLSVNNEISPAPMDTIGSCKRKIDNPVTNKKDKKESTSHHRHVLEVKTPPPIHYNKFIQ